MYLYICICICLFVYLYLCMFICVCVVAYSCLCMFICVCVFVFVRNLDPVIHGHIGRVKQGLILRDCIDHPFLPCLIIFNVFSFIFHYISILDIFYMIKSHLVQGGVQVEEHLCRRSQNEAEEGENQRQLEDTRRRLTLE